MTKIEIIKFLKENKSLLRRTYRVRSIGLFGSYARNENTEESDIDLIVDMEPDFDYFFGLKEFLEASLKKNVDLGMENTLRQFIREKIKNEIIYV
jgi:uncharacterized protein